MFESNATEAKTRKIVDGIPAGCQIVMVAKFADEQPTWFEHLPEFSPKPRSKAVVLGHKTVGNEVFVKVRIKNLVGKSQVTVLGLSHFRTVANDKLRARLLPLAKTRPNIVKIIKKL